MKMKTKAINAVTAFVVLFLSLPQALAQQVKREPAYKLGVRLQSGIYVAIATETDPPEPRQIAFNGFESETGSVVHRVLADTQGGFIYGYDLRVEPLENSKQFRVSISQFSQEFEQRLREGKSFKMPQIRPNFDTSYLSRFNYSQVVNDGDAFAYDLLVNPSTGVKIVDIIKVSYSDILPGEGEPPSREVHPQDFTLSDVELKMHNYRLLVNGELVYGDKPTGGCSGSIIWFYLPGKGRFIFSIIPHEGYDFQKAGLIEHNKISFSYNGDQYEWISSSPIVASGGRWNLYVFYDGDYKPEFDGLGMKTRVGKGLSQAGDSDHLSSFIIGAADSVHLLFQKR